MSTRRRAVGKAIPHATAGAHVTGEALYTDDLCGLFPGLLHAAPVPSAHAHARVLGFDDREALHTPGVELVLSAADVPGEGDTGPARKDEPLFPQIARFEGQSLLWVLAQTEEAAKLGAARVKIQYEPLEPVLDLKDAIAKERFQLEPQWIRRGDLEGALAGAAHRLEGELFLGGQEHFYLETQAAIAHRDESGQLVVHSSTQHPTETQAIVARVLGTSRAEITCQSLRMGGAFGGKETQANAFAAIAALGAEVTGSPVRVRLDRAQDMSVTGKRHPMLARYRVGFDEEGKLLGLGVELFADGGHSLDLSKPILWRAMFHVDNCYLIPNLEVMGQVAETNTVSHTAFRGFGGPQGMVVIEEILSRVAATLELPPHEVRRRNLYAQGDRTHYGQLVRHPGRIARIVAELSESSGLEPRLAEIERFNASNPMRKRGLALTPVKFGISFTTAFFNQAGALLLVYEDGSVQLNHGGTEMGQGLHTKMQQVCADALGISFDAIRHMPTRTDKVPNTSATAASSGSDLNGAAIRDACATLRARLSPVAARLLELDPDAALEFEEDRVFAQGQRERSISFSELASAAYHDRVSLSATGYYRTPEVHFDEAQGRGKPFHYFAYGAAVSEVEVDGYTGQYELLRVDILHDVGDSISPQIDRGQIEGAFVQGAGWLTREELVWSKEGRLSTRGASTYKLPGVGDCPADFRIRLLTQAEEEGVVFGSKAVGEPPFMLAISVREALRQAAAAFSGERYVEPPLPATPEAVYWACTRSR
ncbi:MAG: xanthine dehydrogenase molybdopterin binding subunit [Myxococcales bacterium]|nr:xanthine dehydrogenase molybdopterin binding subunit [Myxococcales bacterium]